jgi:tetratricopeptide (TPR) repeat protein
MPAPLRKAGRFFYVVGWSMKYKSVVGEKLFRTTIERRLIREVWRFLVSISVLVVSVFLVVSLCIVSLSALAQSSDDAMSQIALALRNQDFQKALELIRPALQAFPRNSQLWTMQGAGYAGEGHTKEALASFRNALKISPDYLPALEGAIQIEYEAGDPAAIPLLKRVLQLRPTDATSHGMLAVLEYQQGDYAAAAVHFEKVGSLFDSKPSALHAYAICLVKLNQPDKAAKIFQRALILDPSDRQERRVLASVQLMAHQPQEALAALEPLLQADDESKDVKAETLELAATAYEDSKDTPQAVAALREAILLDPKDPNLYVDFANLSSAHDSFQVGIDVVSDGIGQMPKAAPLYLARGVLYVQLAQYDKAEADFETAHKLDPHQSLSSAAQGLLAEQQNNLDGALATVQTRLAQKPNDAVLLYLRADFLSQKGVEPGTPEFQLAMRSARQAVSLRPGLSGARTVLAKLDLQDGLYPEAVEQCRKALAQDPKDQTALYHLIQALRKTGKTGEIPDLLKRLAQLRKQTAHEDSQRYQYKIVEEEAQPH